MSNTSKAPNLRTKNAAAQILSPAPNEGGNKVLEGLGGGHETDCYILVKIIVERYGSRVFESSSRSMGEIYASRVLSL